MLKFYSYQSSTGRRPICSKALGLLIITTTVVSGCQSVPSTQSPPQSPSPTAIITPPKQPAPSSVSNRTELSQAHEIKDNASTHTSPSEQSQTSVVLPEHSQDLERSEQGAIDDTPDEHSQSTSQTLPIPPKPPKPDSARIKQALLEQARQNSQTVSTRVQSSRDDQLPAFRSLMATGIAQLQRGELSQAEASFSQAQRLAPRSSAVYFYLGQVALKKNQPHKAEAMARRGLAVSQDNSRRQALWQIILKSAQMRQDTRVIQEAKQALR